MSFAIDISRLKWRAGWSTPFAILECALIAWVVSWATWNGDLLIFALGRPLQSGPFLTWLAGVSNIRNPEQIFMLGSMTSINFLLIGAISLVVSCSWILSKNLNSLYWSLLAFGFVQILSFQLILTGSIVQTFYGVVTAVALGLIRPTYLHFKSHDWKNALSIPALLIAVALLGVIPSGSMSLGEKIVEIGMIFWMMIIIVVLGTTFLGVLRKLGFHRNFGEGTILLVFFYGILGATFIGLLLMELGVLYWQVVMALILGCMAAIFYSKVTRDIVSETFRAAKRKSFLLLALVSLECLVLGSYFLHHAPEAAPWYDTWLWWGNALRASQTGSIYHRYSLETPGTTGLAPSGLLGLVFVVLPLASSTLGFMDVFSCFLLIIISMGCYTLIAYLTKRQSWLALIGSAASLLSGAWILFYAGYYTRELLGLTLLIALLAMMSKPEISRKESIAISAIGVLGLSLISELEFLSFVLALILYCSTKILWSDSRRSEFLRLLVILVMIIPYTVLYFWGSIGPKIVPITEYIPNLNLPAPQNFQYQGLSKSLDIFAPTVQNVFSTAFQFYGYSINTSLGLIGFVAFVGTVLYFSRRLRKTAEFFFLFTILVLIGPFILSFWYNAAIGLDLDRRIAVQISLIASVWIGYLATKLSTTTTHKSFFSVVLIFLILSQIGYAISVVSYTDYESQSSVSYALIELRGMISSKLVIVADNPILYQTEGFLSPNYVIDGPYFSSLANSSNNSLNTIVGYVEDNPVILLSMTGNESSLRWLVNIIGAKTGIVAIPLEVGRILVTGQNETLLAVAAQSSVPILLEKLNGSRLNMTAAMLDSSNDHESLTTDNITWYISQAGGWHNLFLKVDGETLHGNSSLEVSVTGDNSDNRFQIFLKDSNGGIMYLYSGLMNWIGPKEFVLPIQTVQPGAIINGFELSDSSNLFFAYDSNGATSRSITLTNLMISEVP